MVVLRRDYDNRASCLFNRLPDEILLYQLTFFHELASHLACSITCRRLRAVYDDTLWRRICISVGLGKPLDIGYGGMAWRQICLTAVVHAKACRLSDCSEAHLSRGRYRGLSTAHCDLLYNADRVGADAVDLQLSSVFENMTGDVEDLFSASIPCNSRPKSWALSNLIRTRSEADLLDSISMCSPHEHERGQMVTKLAHHFPASCGLATVPAVDRLDLDIGRENIQVYNPDGVCAWDIVSALAKRMFKVVSAPENVINKTPQRIYEVIALEWQQHVMLRISLHGRGSINAFVDIGEEISVDHVNSEPR